MNEKPTELPSPECPAPNCIIAAEVRDKLTELHTSVEEVKLSIVGNEKMGHVGIVARLNALDRTVLILAGCVILLGGERLIKLLF